jgi:DNA-binding transcriptional LysR family regulator
MEAINVELRHLRYFVVLAEELHFGRAAERLHIAQPPLSQQIKNLEEEIGAPLFYRTNRTVTLTKSGETFLPRAIQILSQVDKACEAARLVYLGKMGQIVIGFAGGTTYDLLRFQKTFRETYPDVNVILRRLSTAYQVEALHQEKIHIGILHTPIESDQISLLPLRNDRVIVALPENHPLAAKPCPIDARELESEPFIMTPRQAGSAYYNIMMNVCYRAGFIPKVVLEAHEIETILSYVSAGMGISLIPALLQRHPVQGVVYKELLDQTSILGTSMAWRNDEKSQVALAFIELVRQLLN